MTAVLIAGADIRGALRAARPAPSPPAWYLRHSNRGRDLQLARRLSARAFYWTSADALAELAELAERLRDPYHHACLDELADTTAAEIANDARERLSGRYQEILDALELNGRPPAGAMTRPLSEDVRAALTDPHTDPAALPALADERMRSLARARLASSLTRQRRDLEARIGPLARALTGSEWARVADALLSEPEPWRLRELAAALARNLAAQLPLTGVR